MVGSPGGNAVLLVWMKTRLHEQGAEAVSVADVDTLRMSCSIYLRREQYRGGVTSSRHDVRCRVSRVQFKSGPSCASSKGSPVHHGCRSRIYYDRSRED